MQAETAGAGRSCSAASFQVSMLMMMIHCARINLCARVSSRDLFGAPRFASPSSSSSPRGLALGPGGAQKAFPSRAKARPCLSSRKVRLLAGRCKSFALSLSHSPAGWLARRSSFLIFTELERVRAVKERKTRRQEEELLGKQWLARESSATTITREQTLAWRRRAAG